MYLLIMLQLKMIMFKKLIYKIQIINNKINNKMLKMNLKYNKLIINKKNKIRIMNRCLINNNKIKKIIKI